MRRRRTTHHPRAASPLRRLVPAAALVGVVGIAGCSSSGDSTKVQPRSAAPTAAVAVTDQGRSAKPAAAASPTTVASTTTTTASTTTAPTTTTTTAPPAPRLALETGALRSGSKGARTLALQQALIRQKYDPGTPDGSFGLLTTQAVWAWQALHGLPRTGVVEPGVEKLLLEAHLQPMLRPDLGPTHTEVELNRQVLLVFRTIRS